MQGCTSYTYNLWVMQVVEAGSMGCSRRTACMPAAAALGLEDEPARALAREAIAKRLSTACHLCCAAGSRTRTQLHVGCTFSERKKRRAQNIAVQRRNGLHYTYTSVQDCK